MHTSCPPITVFVVLNKSNGTPTHTGKSIVLFDCCLCTVLLLFIGGICSFSCLLFYFLLFCLLSFSHFSCLTPPHVWLRTTKKILSSLRMNQRSDWQAHDSRVAEIDIVYTYSNLLTTFYCYNLDNKTNKRANRRGKSWQQTYRRHNVNMKK